MTDAVFCTAHFFISRADWQIIFNVGTDEAETVQQKHSIMKPYRRQQLKTKIKPLGDKLH